MYEELRAKKGFGVFSVQKLERMLLAASLIACGRLQAGGQSALAAALATSITNHTHSPAGRHGRRAREHSRFLGRKLSEQVRGASRFFCEPQWRNVSLGLCAEQEHVRADDA